MNISRLLGATALMGTLVVHASAFAQTTTQTTEAQTITTSPDAPQTLQSASEDPNVSSSTGADVIVTGTRIRAPNLESVVPVTSVVGEQLFKSGSVSVGDELNDLPALRSTYAQQNPGAGVGVAGLNLLDLYGLGTTRTLVLVNGRRHVASDILNNASSVDVNTIPQDLIDRVDIVTGASSALYGSDAIAGVVNFVLKRDYSGAQLRGRAGVSEAGFGGNQFLSGVAGFNFADGRGNIAVAGEYAHQDRVYGSDIPWYRRVNGFGIIDVDPSLAAQGNSDGFPDRAYLRDIRSSTISPYGIVPVQQNTTTPACGTGLASTNGAPSTVGGTPYSCTYVFDSFGRLSQQTGTRYGSGPNPGFLGGNGATTREGQLLSVYPRSDRWNFNLLSHYEIAPALELFVEAKYAHNTTVGNNAGPGFTQGTRSQFDAREQIRLDNPYLNPADRTVLANAILASNCNTGYTGTCAVQTNVGTAAAPVFIPGNLTAAQRAQVAAGTYRFTLGKYFQDIGNRDELFRRTTWRVVGGVRGTFLDDWSYEVAGNYGKFTQLTKTFGYLDKQRFLLSLDAGRNPVTGNIECRSKFDPTAAIAFPNNAYNQSRLAADVAACVPYNPFGTPDNSAAKNYAVYNAFDRAAITQFDATAYVAGNTGGFLTLPGGPLYFSVGGEYRAEKVSYTQDPFTGNAAGYTTSLTQLSYDPRATKVKEAYGELRVPLVKDVFLLQNLELSGAARVSDYNGSAGTVYAYNYGGNWSPVDAIRFRANYGRAVRAPNASETAGALTPNFANGFADPCRRDSVGTGSQYRAANCAADLGALQTAPDFFAQPTYSLKVLSGSNPDLQAEKSDSYTYGVVLQPSFVRNLSLSVDYYNIRVNGVITAVSAQQIANSCYDLPSLDNPFCGLFQRYRGAAGTRGPDNEIAGQILSNTLIQAPLNYASLVRRGLNTQVNYRFDVSNDVRVSASVVYLHQFQYSSYTNPADPTFENVGLEELGNPKDEVVFDTDVALGALTLGYRLHYISPMYLNTYEDYNSVGGRQPENADYADIKEYPSIAYHNIRFEYNLKDLAGVGRDFQLFGGVDNVLDQHPPLGSTATGSGSAIYDVRGRAYYAGFRARF